VFGLTDPSQMLKFKLVLARPVDGVLVVLGVLGVWRWGHAILSRAAPRLILIVFFSSHFTTLPQVRRADPNEKCTHG